MVEYHDFYCYDWVIADVKFGCLVLVYSAYWVYFWNSFGPLEEKYKIKFNTGWYVSGICPFS